VVLAVLVGLGGGQNGLQPLTGLVRSGSSSNGLNGDRVDLRLRPSEVSPKSIARPTPSPLNTKFANGAARSGDLPAAAPNFCPSSLPPPRISIPRLRRVHRRPRISPVSQVAPIVSNASLVPPSLSYPPLPFFYHPHLFVACLSRRQLARLVFLSS
jgi:hypothetical protein